MCHPAVLAVLSTGLSIAQTGAQYAQQKAAADAQRDAQRRVIAARQAQAIARYGEIQADRVADRERAADRNADVREQEIRKRARARVSRGEAGVTGLSVDALDRDIAARHSRERGQIQSQLSRAESAAERAKTQERLRTRAAFAGMIEPAGPNVVNAGLKVATDVVRLGAALSKSGASQ